MRSTKTITIVLATLTLAIMAIPAIAQTASPTPRVSPTPRILPSPASPGGEIITLDPTPSPFPSPPTSPSPVPMLYLTKVEPFTANNKNFIRYSYDVLNKMVYPAALFAPAPNLPPCGANANSSRTWVDFFNQGGTRTLRILRPRQAGGSWLDLVCTRGRRNPSELDLHRDERSPDEYEIQIEPGRHVAI